MCSVQCAVFAVYNFFKGVHLPVDNINLQGSEEVLPADIRQEDVERLAGAGQAAWGRK